MTTSTTLAQIETLKAQGYHTVLFLDASAFKQATCLQRLKYIIVDGLTSAEFSSPLSYGTSLHKFVAKLRSSGGDYTVALTEGIKYYSPFATLVNAKDFRTVPHLIVACGLYYNRIYKTDTFQTLTVNDVPLIEQKFAFPCTEIFPELEEVCKSSGVMILLSGTSDEIGTFEAGNFCIKDIKTMATNPYYVMKNLESYKMSIQLMFYKMIVEHLLKLPNVGAFIEAVVTDNSEQGKKGSYPISFARSEVFQYSEEQMMNFKFTLLNTLQDILTSKTDNFWPMNFQCCSNSITVREKVGQCSFFNLCATTDDDLRKHYREKEFKVREFNPLKYDEIGLE